MIRCNHLSKAYDRQLVLDNCTCSFQDTGFYLLLGESGSGKTTFLNVLAGFLPFEAGTVDWNGHIFENQVDTALIEQELDYITQDTFFVDFLNVRDNLRLILDDDGRILELLSQFGLGDKADQMPTTLSGGERQRLAIVRAMLGGKKVLLLDEPTAALDEDNKIAIFELLTKLKQELLIICSTHDLLARDYADEVLPFSKNLHPAIDLLPLVTTPKPVQPVARSGEKENLNYFLRQWFRSPRRNRKSSIQFAVFLVLSLCLCLLADLPQHKMDSSIEHLYKLNFLTVETYGKTRWAQITPSNQGIREIVLNYASSCPDGAGDHAPGDLIIPSVGHETSLYTLPYSKEVFRLSDKIIYGSYYTAPEQIILSWELANALAPNDPQALIGEHLPKTVYGLGTVNFEIVGIFDRFNAFEKQYLQALGVQTESLDGFDPAHPERYSRLFYINSRLTQKLEQDAGFFMGHQRSYQIYFRSYSEMRAYYDQYADHIADTGSRIEYSTVDFSLYRICTLLFYICTPIAFTITLFAILFYVALRKTELVYNSSFIAVFEYSGYNKLKVINRFVLLNTLELFRSCLIALAIALAISVAVNMLNSRLAFMPFQIITYNIWMIGGFVVFMLSFSALLVNLFFRKVKVSSWYENLIAGRDLI